MADDRMTNFSVNSYINHGFEIRHISETKGRGMFTTKPFKAGEIILEEMPLFSAQFSWNLEYGYAACDFCMSPLETAEENARRLTGKQDLVLPHPDLDGIDKSKHEICPYCAIPYCCSSCREMAWNSYHQVLCLRTLENSSEHPIKKLNETWKTMHYPPETTSIMLLARILAALRQHPNKVEIKQKLLSLCHHAVNDEEQIAHKLLGKEFENQLEILRHLTIAALGTQENEEFLSQTGFQSLFALIGRNGQGVGTSSFSVWVRNITDKHSDEMGLDKLIDSIYEDMDKESGDFLNNEGSALYYLQSACNHSCDPNSEGTFPYSNHKIVLVASKDLNSDEEIVISYLDECALSRSRISRQKILQENYLFNCACSRCLNEADNFDVTSDDESMEES